MDDISAVYLLDEMNEGRQSKYFSKFMAVLST